MLEKIQALFTQIEDLHAKNLEELEALRIKFLSKKGCLNDLMSEFRNVSSDQKREIGMKLNDLKRKLQDKLNTLRQDLAVQEDEQDDLDLTRTPYPIALGSRHPISIVKQRLVDIFSRMGFTMADGPEVEDDWHVFSSMNFADDHPARDMQDTFFIERQPDILLRTGRVYRNEAISSRAHCFFHQLEGLYIDENVSFADLKQVMLSFARELFGPDTQIRLRPSYFPFTEPSAEMDISCFICGGDGCSLCKKTGWVEILGCGEVDPNVLENCGIDSTRYKGYAIANLLYRVSDLRLFSENNVKFLEEFTAAN